MKTKHNLIPICLLGVALLAIHSYAQSVTTYSTLGPSDVYDPAKGWLVNGSASPPQPFVGEAFAFTPTVSGYLSQVRLAMSANSSDLASDLANILIAGNRSGNLPGTTLESFLNVSCPGFFGNQNPLVSLTSIVNPYLQSGSTYWLCVTPALPTANISVNQNSLGLQAPQAQEFSPGAWIARGNKNTFGFDVEVVVPEPSATTILAVGAALLTIASSKRSSALAKVSRLRQGYDAARKAGTRARSVET